MKSRIAADRFFDNPFVRVGYYVLQLTWGIIQNIGGGAMWLFLFLKNPKRKRWRYRGAFVISWDIAASAGVGMFIFFGHEGSPDAQRVMVHEFGHTVQSIILGPLFLPVIVLPSALWAYIPKFEKKRKQGLCSYYDFYPERWANRCGEKVTGKRAPK